MFAKNFFEAGGIEGISVEGQGGSDEMIAAFKNSATPLVCLCSSDEVYAGGAAAAAKALKDAGAEHIYLAGRPTDQENALRDAGVQTFIYSGCDVLATLQAAHDILKARR
jgi:methylmalonyl-CoA mutase